jgi:hypothetical protein
MKLPIDLVFEFLSLKKMSNGVMFLQWHLKINEIWVFDKKAHYWQL